MSTTKTIHCNSCKKEIKGTLKKPLDTFQLVVKLHYVDKKGMGKQLIVDLCPICKAGMILKFKEMEAKPQFELMQ